MNHNYPFGIEHGWPVIDGPHEGQSMSSLAPVIVAYTTPPLPSFGATPEHPTWPGAERVEYRLFRIADGIFVWSTKSELVLTPVA